MNVVWSSDENYVQHLAVSVLSFLECNKMVTTINCFVISNNITDTSKEEIERVVKEYQRKISWIEFDSFKQNLKLDMAWPISISSYARLFLQKILPESVERVIYLDCDTVVCDSLEKLYNLNMEDCSVAGVADFIYSDFKKLIGNDSNSQYINAGVLLIDLKAWRKNDSLGAFLHFIDSCRGRVPHHDQGVVNKCLCDKIYVLPPKYNAMTPLFTLKYKGIKAIWGKYYTKQERQEAIETPIILHFTPAFSGHVWNENCTHPLKNCYVTYLDKTIWKDSISKDNRSIKIIVINWLAINMPRIYQLCYILTPVLLRRRKHG